MFRPTVDEIVAIHREEVGPPYELRDRVRLEAALEAPWHSAGGEDAYPSVHMKAAILYRGIDRGQPFEDGNKRTAMLAVGLFYAYQGYEFEAPPTEGWELASYVAESTDAEAEWSVVADAFAQWAMPIPDPLDDY